MLPLRVIVDLGVMVMKGVLHTFQISRTGTSPSDAVLGHTKDTFLLGGDMLTVYPLQGIESAYSKTQREDGER